MMTSPSEPLAPFEERLLAELKQELTARPPALGPVRTGPPRPHRVAAAAAAVGLGAAVAAGLTVATRTTPAGPSRAPLPAGGGLPQPRRRRRPGAEQPAAAAQPGLLR